MINVYFIGNIWFFHSDHLGSSSLITNRNGAISLQIEYLPYGEVFLEKQPQVADGIATNAQPYQTPYRFNGKELDEETGLYYYGARYMNPRLSIWYGTDRYGEKYPILSSYSICKARLFHLRNVVFYNLLDLQAIYSCEQDTPFFLAGKELQNKRKLILKISLL